MPLAHGALVDVAGEDQVGAGLDEPGEHVVAACDRFLARAPRGADQVVVEHDDLEGVGLCLAQPRFRLGELRRP